MALVNIYLRRQRMLSMVASDSQVARNHFVRLYIVSLAEIGTCMYVEQLQANKINSTEVLTFVRSFPQYPSSLQPSLLHQRPFAFKQKHPSQAYLA